ncbi:MAG: flagellar hook-associated protein FlgK [Phycisphaerales bacterium]
MGLTASLLIGQTALSASQVALQVAGNNIANAATPGYSRQRVGLSAISGQRVNANSFVGRGVQLTEIKRIVDPSLIARVRAASATQAAAATDASLLAGVESITNELTGFDLSTQLNTFFNTFSELANTPTQPGTKALAVEQGVAMAQFLRELRGEMVQQRQLVDSQLTQQVAAADALLSQVAALNAAIIGSEGGSSGQNAGLRDQRDAVLDELAQLMDITVVEESAGSVNVLVDSVPVVLGSESRGLKLVIESGNGQLNASVATRVPQQETIDARSGSIGALLEQRETALIGTISSIDTLTANLIFEVNKAHALGSPGKGLASVLGTVAVGGDDPTLPLNDPDNASIAGLPFKPKNGSFEVTIVDGNGNTQSHTIFVDLDGINASGEAGYEDDSTLESIVAELNAIPNLNASITAEGKLSMTTATGYMVSFAKDSSNLMATLGVNSYFTGTDATNIGVRADLAADPSLLSVGFEGSNETALALANLRDKPLGTLGGNTMLESWNSTSQGIAVSAASANVRLESLTTVRGSLEAQRQAISGVSMDEESIDLITYQNQYQGAARFISVINELTAALLTLV